MSFREFIDYAKWGDPTRNQTRLRELLCLTDDFLKARGLPYWIDFGVLLGAVRHGRLIPWDHDLDIGMCGEPFRALVTECERLRISGALISDGLRFQWACDNVYRFLLGDVWVDIFEYEERDGKLCPALSVADREGDPCYADHPAEDILPLRELSLDGRWFSAPRDPAACLRRYYGDYSRLPRIPLFFLYLHHPLAAAGLVRR